MYKINVFYVQFHNGEFEGESSYIKKQERSLFMRKRSCFY
ncbi:hypothetical protein FH5_00087 [Priestia endophytica]|nr:hypothetical protein FH5_00087 [Priestia endophytica]